MFFTQIFDWEGCVRGGGGLSSLFDEFLVVTAAMTSVADGRSRFPRRRVAVGCYYYYYLYFVYKPPRPSLLAGRVFGYSAVHARVPRGGRRGRRRRFVFIFSTLWHCGPVALLLPPRPVPLPSRRVLSVFVFVFVLVLH